MTVVLQRWVPPILFILGLALLWELAVNVMDVPSYILPAPTQIATSSAGLGGVLAGHVVATAAAAVVGLVLGAGVGVGVAVAIWVNALVRRVLYPLMVGSQTIPMVVLAPLLVLWFGLGLTPKVLVVALIAVFPVAVSTIKGLEDADTERLDLLHSMGASRGQVLRLVLIPSALPGFFAGLQISAAYAVAGAVIGEWVGAARGLGLFITRSQASFRVDRVFVGVAVIVVLSVVLFGAVNVMARLATPWRYVKTGERL